MSGPSSSEIATAVRVLQDALDGGVDLALHFGTWTRLQRRTLSLALGASEATYADAKAAAATPPVKKAPARPSAGVAKASSPAPSSTTQPAPEPMDHLSAPAGGQAVFGKSPPPATWSEVGFQTREHAEMAAAMNYVSALAFYAAMGRGELQVGPQPQPPPPRQPAQAAAASSSDDQAGPLAGYLAEADAKAAEDRRMREIQERIAGELRQDEADRDAASRSASRPARPRASFPEPSTTPAPVQARYPHANRETGEGFPALPRKPARNASAAVAEAADREYRAIVEDHSSAEWRAHIRAMEAAGAQSSEQIVNEDLAQLAVANLTQLQDIEQQAATGDAPMMPLAGAAAYFFVRSLPPGVRGMRVPERLNGEVWVVGWCGRPCPAGRGCLSTVDRCLRPIVVRRGAGARLGDLAAHEHHECSECHRAGRRGRDY